MTPGRPTLDRENGSPAADDGWRPIRLVALLLVLVGVGIIFTASSLGDRPKGIEALFEPMEMRLFRLQLVGAMVTMAGWAMQLLVKWDRFTAGLLVVFILLLSGGAAWQLGLHESGTARAIAGGLLVLMFLAPFPWLILLYRQRQDELERGLATGAAAVAFIATLSACAAYWMLDRIFGLPELTTIWVVWIGLGLWGTAWLLLRIRVT